MPVPPPERLPRTADHCQRRGKPAALIPGRCGVIHEDAPRALPWIGLLRHGARISAEQFRKLLHSQG